MPATFTNVRKSQNLTREDIQIFEAARAAVTTLTKTFEL
jgi:hypothetical protein